MEYYNEIKKEKILYNEYLYVIIIKVIDMLIKIDSRQVKPGDTFIALRGVSQDGHSYIEKAIENGATKIIAEYGSYSVPTEIVPDTREYLINYLSENYNDKLSDMKFIGITGTNGKTTTAFLIHEALNNLGIKCGYIGTVGFYVGEKIRNLNNTTPDVYDLYNMFLECHDIGCKYIVQEVSSQGLAYKRVEGYKFDYAIFTNLTQDHLDYHKNMENYALAKQALFNKLKPDGVAIINYDDEYKNYFMLPNNKNITYGFYGGDYQITNFKMTNQATNFSYDYDSIHYDVHSPLLGKYNVYNMLVTIIVLKTIGIEDHNIEKIIPKLNAPKGRMETILYKTNTIIIDYAHTPDALSKIINTMLEVSNGNLYVVFGCTGDRDRTKRPIMTDIACRFATKVFLTHDDPHNESQKQIFDDMLEGIKYDNYEIFYDRKKAIISAIDSLDENDILLILGKGHEEYIIVNDEKIPFNDGEIVKEYI